MTPEVVVGAVLLASLILYALGGGADFGGGVWDLFAHGRTAERQRALIANAIGPIWEANHVWLILAIVLLFVCFPLAFAAISTALHVPLTLMLIGIVLRGSAFAFRSYDPDDRMRRRWGRLFAIASVVTPVMLGVCVGAVLSGRIRVDVATGEVRTDFVSAWLAPFPFAVGAFALALFAMLAAVYLTMETRERDLRRAFRARAMIAVAVSGALAWLCFHLAREGAPLMHRGLADRDWSMPFQIATGGIGLVLLESLWKERYPIARGLAVALVTLVICGWGFAQFPYVVEPDLTLANTAAPANVLRAVLAALAVGAAVLLPSLAYLYWVFKGSRVRAGAPDAE